MSDSVICQYVSDEEANCDEEAEWVLRVPGQWPLPPWRNRVPVCEEHRVHLLTDPDVEIRWENQGRVDEFPRDSLYGYRDEEADEGA